MKYWYIAVIFLIGFAITIVGALFKIMHWPGAAMMLMFGMALKVIAVVLLIVKLVANRNNNNILNK